MKKLFLPITLLFSLNAGAQLFIDGATFFIDNGAVVTVQGDVTSNVNIQSAGTGKIRLGGSGPQVLNMGGKDIPNLQIDNATGQITLSSNTRITTSLEFTTGRVMLGSSDLVLGSAAVVTGAGTAKFAETNGTGVVKKELTAAGTTTIPVGNGTVYTPVDYTVVGGTFGASSFVSARSVAAAHPNKHPRSTDFLKNYWQLNNNIAGATITSVGNYVNPASVTGDQALIVSMLYNGTTWAKGTSQTATSVTAPAPANASRDLYGMNKFILSSPKIYLQGSYAGVGLMNDLLRNSTGVYSVGTLPASNLIPVNDPYRTATYSSAFPHVNNASPETISTDVLKDLANPGDQIVDWVFIELRTNATPSTVIQTRSGLLQRDGDVVDIDGVSPIYFKNLDPAMLNISVRHRNHLSTRTPSATSLNLTTPLTKINYSSALANNLGNFAVNLGGGVFGLYAGNCNLNGSVRISGPSATISDYLSISSILGANISLTNTYSPADLNMNRTARISGPSTAISDYLYLSSVLGSNTTITQPAQ